jgi:transcriptional regulator with PAS, ATPase and Fis domain
MNIDNSVQNLLASEKSLDAYNHEIIKHFLNKYNHNVRLVANKLGVGKSTIYRMLQEGIME